MGSEMCIRDSNTFGFVGSSANRPLPVRVVIDVVPTTMLARNINLLARRYSRLVNDISSNTFVYPKKVLHKNRLLVTRRVSEDFFSLSFARRVTASRELSTIRILASANGNSETLVLVEPTQLELVSFDSPRVRQLSQLNHCQFEPN